MKYLTKVIYFEYFFCIPAEYHVGARNQKWFVKYILKSSDQEQYKASQLKRQTLYIHKWLGCLL